jgi:hypothetical protein
MTGTDELVELALEAIESGDDSAGFCTTCHDRRDGWTEPDAREYPCDVCRTPTVYGAQEILLMFVA